MAYRILLTGGGSGGHVYPLIAVAEDLRELASQKNINLKMEFIGDAAFFRQVIGKNGISSKNILAPKWRRYNSLKNFIDILKLPVAIVQSFFYVWLYMPDLIFSKGGYDSFLPSLVGRIFLIPLVIHESDAIPGKANLWLGGRAKKIFLGFEEAKNYFKNGKTETVGNPIRKGLLNITDRTSAITSFSLDPAKPTILITGASQGAQVINRIILSSLVELTKRFQIIHQCGFKNYDETNAQILKTVKEGETSYGPNITQNYRLYPFFDLGQMALAYSAADVVVCRAGGQSIFEAADLGKPSILIPLKGSANDHQLTNAKEFAKFGALVIEEDNLTPHLLINSIQHVYDNRSTISQKIRQFARPDAARTIAQDLLNIIAG
jgi:UDP-N-acetylglucosamine--N-acetylmuramyl-(pentapeptide) pyrophosphoryl-undecaprenol N-acetylglucosamine transferase